MISKTKRRSALLGIAFSIIAFSASAQNKAAMQNSTPEQRAKMQTEWMKNKLALNAAQIEQVQALNLEYALKNAPVLQSDEKKLSKLKKLKASQKEKDASLSKILDASQYEKYQELKEQMLEALKEKKQ
ncbi:hypothetical protein [Chitinophaga sp. CF418]|uniref:hypothetical protein n=1 Tax=Chitinophaga sp. CF418 TaxID=1855287 RepID=UPI000912F0A5|nr:hypothetical protein [Chitinophaga sp. CF418]SHN76748.1 hypothetical protein SAMN05216311_11317 [Chitinophaga sp. CF418]